MSDAERLPSVVDLLRAEFTGPPFWLADTVLGTEP